MVENRGTLQSDDTAKKAQFNYRDIIVKDAGVMICVFGNKINQDGEIEDASGVQEEFEIAYRNGLKIIPVGATGFATQRIYRNLMNNFLHYYNDHPKLKKQFQILGNNQQSHTDIIQSIKIILNTINKF